MLLRKNWLIPLFAASAVTLCGMPATIADMQRMAPPPIAPVPESLHLGWVLGDGFYRVDGRPEVYMVSNTGSYCHVYDPGELDALASAQGWEVRVTDLVSSSGVSGWAALLWRTYTGYCGYPSGMYRRQSEAEVYLLTGSQYCWVRDSAQVNRLGGWDAVFVLDKPAEKSRFQDGRAYTGLCPF